MKIGSPLTLDLTNTKAFRTWLYDLWRSTGGDTTSITTIEADISELEANQVLTKQTIVDLGSTYVFDKTINVVDADVTINSKIMAQIAPIASGYTRPIEEVIYEKITIQPMPKAGSIDFYIQPERGHFKGEFVINYMVKI